MKEVVAFLRELQKNNNTEWFHAHRAEYEKAKKRFGEMAERLIQGIAAFDPSVAGLELKDCTYRINRDIRFSQDKSPYKTHFGLFVCPGGKKSGFAGYYFHLSVGGDGYPDQNMIAAGHYCYEKRVVEIIREDLEDEGAQFDAMIQDLKKIGMELDFDNSLKKAPKGFENSPYADYARLKNYCLGLVPDESVIYSDDLVDHLLSVFKRCQPFISYLNKVIEYARTEEE